MQEPANQPAGADQRLAVYGTLAPGRSNAHLLDGLAGRWVAGTVRGYLRAAEWGVHRGLLGLVLDPDGPMVEAMVFESADLGDHWPRLDEFEGPAFRRASTIVESEEGPLAASIYLLVDP